MTRGSVIAGLLGVSMVAQAGCAASSDPGPAPGALMPTARRQVQGERPWEFTVYDAGPADGGHVLYYLHGAGGDAATWAQAHQRLRAELARLRVPITVVAVSFGPRWFLVPRNRSPTSGLLDVFRREVMPRVEAALARPVRRRSVLGVSMGGYNAFQLLSRDAGFDDVALVSPALLAVSRYAPAAEIDAFLDRTAAASMPWWQRLRGRARARAVAASRVGVIFGSHGESLPDPASWDDASPVARAAGLSGRNGARLYVSCGRRDEYGFFEASEQVARLAAARGIDTVWVPLPGDHSTEDPVSLARFLAEGHARIPR